jgi:adenylosuccinate synthase
MMGVGEAVRDRDVGVGIVAGDICDPLQLRLKLEAVAERQFKRAVELLQQFPSVVMQDTYDHFRSRWRINEIMDCYQEFLSRIKLLTDTAWPGWESGQPFILEGAQGALLDPVIGYKPFVTHTGSTFSDAEGILNDQDLSECEIERWGVLRAYANRHGSGPFVTEDTWLIHDMPELHNCFNDRQGRFRLGWFDLLSSRYAVSAGGKTDRLSLTGLDRLSGLPEIKVCTAYQYLGSAPTLQLDRYFRWHQSGRRIIITAIEPKVAVDEELARLLFDCQPVKYCRFPGWTEDVSSARQLDDLPTQARAYLDFLSRELKTPFGLISVGPTAEHKIEP